MTRPFSALRNPVFLRELTAVFEPEHIFHRKGLVVETRPKNWFLYDYDTEYNEDYYGYDNAAATPAPGTLEPEIGPLQSIPVKSNPSLAPPTSPALASSSLDAIKFAASPMGSGGSRRKTVRVYTGEKEHVSTTTLH
ncbi:hypothetical protein H1R20_g7279, partial [Candolleomyces eurysporus]